MGDPAGRAGEGGDGESLGIVDGMVEVRLVSWWASLGLVEVPPWVGNWVPWLDHWLDCWLESWEAPE